MMEGATEGDVETGRGMDRVGFKGGINNAVLPHYYSPHPHAYTPPIAILRARHEEPAQSRGAMPPLPNTTSHMQEGPGLGAWICEIPSSFFGLFCSVRL